MLALYTSLTAVCNEEDLCGHTVGVELEREGTGSRKTSTKAVAPEMVGWGWI